MAWSITIKKRLTEFFEGLTSLPEDFKNYIDLIFLDLDPLKTRQIPLWEKQFGLQCKNLTDEQRRQNIDNAWKTQGGQDVNYIQNILQGAGFDVYIHEWWVSGTEPEVGVNSCATPKNPFLYLRDSSTNFSGVDCGEPLAECGEPFAECGNSFEPLGYVLVNKVLDTDTEPFTLCGEPFMECGEPLAECGNYNPLIQEQKEYILPQEQEKWSYIMYIGAEVFPNTVNIPQNRKEEFEDLCLKICPLQQWLGIMATYS